MVNINAHIKQLILGATLLLAPTALFADDQDFATDFDAGVEKNITKKWDVDAGAELRLCNNDHNLDRWALEAGTSYELLKWLKASAGYEFLNDWNGEDKNYFTHRHRWNIALSSKYKVNKRLSFSGKVKFQQTYRSEEYKTYAQNSKNHIRFKVEGDYKIKKTPLYPHLSAELFYFCNSIDGNTIDDMRYNLGVTYKLGKKNAIDLSFQIDDAMNVAEPEDRFMLCIGYKYKL